MALITGCISYWKFDENTGTTLNDATGNGNTGTFQGTTGSQWVAGKINSGLAFDGTDNYVSTTTQFTSPTAFTISCWVKSTVSNGNKIFGFENNQTGNTSGSFDRMIYLGTDGQAYFGIYNGSTLSLPGGVIDDGNWHMCTGTYDGTNMVFYINGTLHASTTTSNVTYTGYWRMGSYALGSGWINANSGFFTGDIDECGLWNRALTSSEVTALYNNGAGLQYPFPQGGLIPSISSNLIGNMSDLTGGLRG